MYVKIYCLAHLSISDKCGRETFVVTKPNKAYRFTMHCYTTLLLAWYNSRLCRTQVVRATTSRIKMIPPSALKQINKEFRIRFLSLVTISSGRPFEKTVLQDKSTFKQTY